MTTTGQSESVRRWTTKQVVGGVIVALVALVVGGLAARWGVNRLLEGPSLDEQWRRIRESIATNPPGQDTAPIRITHSERVNFRGAGPKSYLVIAGTGDRKAATQLRVYDVTGNNIELAFIFNADTHWYGGGVRFESSYVGDIDGDGAAEVLGGVRELQGMGPSYVYPVALGWDDAASRYRLRPIEFDKSAPGDPVGESDYVLSDPNGTQTKVPLTAHVLDWSIVGVDDLPVLVTVYDPYPLAVDHVTAWRLTSWTPTVAAELCTPTVTVKLHTEGGLGNTGLGQAAGDWWKETVGHCTKTLPDSPLPG